MKIAFLFPGQGSQASEMGKDLYDSYPEYKKIYDEVNKITGLDVASITFDKQKEDLLNQTKYTQISILTMSLAILELLKKENIKAQISAGLSLGEYSALIYSNAISFEEGIKIIQKRGEYMQELVPKGDWQMAAIIGLNEMLIRKACDEVKCGFVTLANFNSPQQIAISGERKAVEEASENSKKLGAKRVIPLKTSGPFHTEMLKEASEKLKLNLEKIKFNKFNTAVVRNIDGKKYEEKDNMAEILSKHIISPVRFVESIKSMLEENVDTFIEIGPGKTLTSFVRKTDPNVKTFNIYDKKSFEETVKQIKE